jgi:hypothetical protein
MRVSEAINFAYSAQYRGHDMAQPHQAPRSSSTDQACRQALAGMIYRAVERLPESSAALVRICYTEAGTAVDEIIVYRYAASAWAGEQHKPQLPAIIMLVVRNFPGVVSGRDIYNRADFARAAGVSVAHYTKALLPIQRHIEDILITALTGALEPVRKIIRQQEG